MDRRPQCRRAEPLLETEHTDQKRNTNWQLGQFQTIRYKPVAMTEPVHVPPSGGKSATNSPLASDA
jgi:hypothetical protein